MSRRGCLQKYHQSGVASLSQARQLLSPKRLRFSVKGFVQKDCIFAGHLLKEYSALA